MRWLAVNPYSSEYGSCDVPIMQEVGEGARLVVSEPFGCLPGAWVEVPGEDPGNAGGDRRGRSLSNAGFLAPRSRVDRRRRGRGCYQEPAGGQVKGSQLVMQRPG